MKAMTRYLVLLSMLAVGCGDSSAGDGNGSGTSGSALKCDAIGGCTSWASDRAGNGRPRAGGRLGA